MSDYLLIHGGSRGAWCWRRLIGSLAELGHRGHALDLPGAGEDPTPRTEVTVEGCLDTEDRRPAYLAMAEASPDRTLRLGYEDARRRFFEDLSEEDARACFARLTPQPLSVYLEPATLAARDIPAPKRCVVCTRDATFPPEHCRAMAGKLSGETAVHDAMLSHPEELARVLARPAAGA